MSIWKTEINLEKLAERNKNNMAEFLGIQFIEIGDNFLVATMPVNERTRQPLGIMHGGASCVLAETIGSVAANYAVDYEKFYCVGLVINTNHIRSIRQGLVIGKAEPYHLGKTTQVWSIPVKNENDKLISITRLTMAVLKQKN